jgi:aryl-alcohol dehydrogenase-like predicted oxidoreductase
MEYIYLGNTGFKISSMCFGALTIGPLQSNLSIKEGASVIRYALECGINFIDTAKLYGTYPYIREALKGWDKEVIIVSKSYDYTWDGMKQSVEEARTALDRDYIDVFMLHEQESELTLQGHAPAFEYLQEAKKQGLIRAIGVSTHTVNVVEAALKREYIEVIHPIVNCQGLGLLDGTKEELEKAVKKAFEKGKGLYGMKPLGGGNLINNARFALEYAFKFPYTHSTAVGCKSREEVDYNLHILEGITPPKSLSDKVKAIPRRLHFEDWCEGCGTCVKKCPGSLLAIKDGKAFLAKDGCLFCGYCGAVCPQFAIKVL